MRDMIRPAWQGDEQQKQLLQAAVKAVRQARSAEDAAWAAMQAARASGVPDEVLCSGTGISRSTLNRKLGRRPRKAEDVESYAEEVHVPESRIPEHPPVVAAIVISDRGVLISRRNDGVPPWGFISGKIEPGESQADAAVREVKEETGLVIEPAPYEIGRRVHPKTGKTMIYLACTPKGSLEASVEDEDELAEVKWATLAEVDELMPGVFEPVYAHLQHQLGPA